MRPSKQQIANGTFKRIDGAWHKRCTGLAHDEPTWLPANEKYFYVFKSGKRKGALTSRCRLCTNWAKIKTHGSEHGYVPVRDVQHFFVEAVNRIGTEELARRTGLSPNTITPIIFGRNVNVRKMTVRKVVLELISMRRKGEFSTSKSLIWRNVGRANGYGKTCPECGVPIGDDRGGVRSDAYTADCSMCQGRKHDRFKRVRPASSFQGKPRAREEVDSAV